MPVPNPPTPPNPPGPGSSDPVPRPKPPRPKPPRPVPPRPATPPPAGGPPEPPPEESVPVTTSASSAAPVMPAPENIAIHTMQDDLAAARNPRATRAASPQAAPAQAPSPERPALPLPPKSAAQPAGQKQKVINEPRRSRARPRRRWLAVAGTVAVLLLLISSAAAAWLWLGTGINIPDPAAPADTPGDSRAAAILPANTAIMIQYNLESSANRSAVVSAWEAAPTQAAGPTTSLLAGNPKALINDATVTELYYVLLPGESRPYLVVPINDATTTALVNNPDVTLTEQSGWYIAHPVSTQSYRNALAGGTLADQPDAVVDRDVSAPMQIFLGPAAIRELRRTLGGSRLNEGSLQTLALAANIEAESNALRLSGTASTLGTVARPGVSTDQQLLAAVPSTASVVHLGANFGQDTDYWAQLGNLIDPASITRLGLLDRLTAPYAFYRDATVPTNEAYGLIIKRPPGLVGITLDDPDLVAAMSQVKQFVAGQRVLAPIEFNNASLNETPLRYANVNGPTQAIDYALTDQLLLLATSKDAMQTLMTAAQGTGPSLADNPDYQRLLSVWGALPASPDLLLGTIEYPQLAQLLPVQDVSGAMPFGLALASTPDASSHTASGILLLESR